MSNAPSKKSSLCVRPRPLQTAAGVSNYYILMFVVLFFFYITYINND